MKDFEEGFLISITDSCSNFKILVVEASLHD